MTKKWENMTTAVTSTGGLDMTTNAIKVDLIMAMGSESMPRLRSSMHLLHRRASGSFSHPFLFLFTNKRPLCRQPGVHAELTRAVASDAICYVDGGLTNGAD